MQRNRINLTRACVLVAPAALVIALTGCSGGGNSNPGYAGTAQPANFAQRHPMATGLAAGYGAYKLSKTTGANRMANGGSPNFAQRHPFLTGAAAAAAAHHFANH